MHCKTQAQLTQKLEELSPNGDESVALVFMFQSPPNESDVRRLRETVKICDIVIVAGTQLKAADAQNLAKLGADATFTPHADNRLCTVDAGVKGLDTTFILQAILASLPNLVVTDPKNLPLKRTLQNLQQTFGPLFSLRDIG